MKKILSIMCFGVLTTVSSIAIAGGDANAGKNKVATCGACHGDDGNSVIGANPKLAGQGESYLFKQLKDIKSGSRSAPLMAGQLDNMSDQDLRDIAAFYSAQPAPLGVAKEEWLELGQEVYRAGNADRGISACTGCHGPTGSGIGPAGFPRLAGQHAEYIADQLRKFSVGERANDGEARIMRDIAERMNENEIKAVSSYIAGLRD